MIQVSTLCDEYIDGPKLTEQTKMFENIVPPPQVGRNNKDDEISSMVQDVHNKTPL